MPALSDMDPALALLVERRRKAKSLPPYVARTTSEIRDALGRMLAVEAPDAVITSVARLGGGASKEQFIFGLRQPGSAMPDEEQRYVLRADPQCPIIETDCRREFEMLNLMIERIPVPRPAWLDADGRHFGRPAMITGFVEGVTKPTRATMKVSGMGTWLGEPLRTRLKQQFLDILVRIHGTDWRKAGLRRFGIPDRDPLQAARWSLNFWKALWEMDKVEDRPIVSLARNWLEAHVPPCAELVVTHGDFRTGNYLFDEAAGQIKAVLDWELARIGDYHEDLGWILMRVFGTHDGATFRASDLYEREEFIAAYESATGRTVHRPTLRFYEVLSSWKCYVVVSSGLSSARAFHSHQDILLTYLSAAAAVFANDLAQLLKTEI